MDPPTDAEKHDAIRVMEEVYVLGMEVPTALLEEAERIFDEASS